MSEHPIEGLMLTAMNSIQDMVDVNTIIGEPIESILKKKKKSKYNTGCHLVEVLVQGLAYRQLHF